MSEYLYLSLKQAGPRIHEQATETTFKEVSGKEAALIPVPIPPLDEQHRIVAQADQLMDLLDQLNVHLTAQQAAQNTFVIAVLHNLDT